MPGPFDLFVNYRRADTPYGASAVYEHLARAFGKERVFLDSGSILPGELFPPAIQRALEEIRVLIAVVGPRWFEKVSASGNGGGRSEGTQRRIDQEDDWVRLEISRALARGIPVVQVLLDGAAPVKSEELPGDIARLALCQAVHIRQDMLGEDVRSLVDRLVALVPELLLPDCFEQHPPLPPEPLPSMLLQSHHRVVPFRRSDRELPDLEKWLASPESQAVRLLTGPGGQGKTRLGQELVESARSGGWAAGFLAEDVPADVLRRVHEFRDPVLFVVDYAEGRYAPVAALAAQMVQRPVGHGRARLLLLARSSGMLPQMLRGDRDDRVSLLFTDLPVHALSSVVSEPEDRPTEYTRALEAFSRRLGIEAPETPAPSDLAGSRYDRVLDVHAAALAALLDGRCPEEATPARRDPLLRVLDHERRYWQAGVHLHELPDPHRSRLDQVVSAASLFGAEDSVTARSLLKRLPTFEGVPSDTVERYRRWLAETYPGRSALNPLRPDRLGEDLVAYTLRDQEDFVAPLAADLQDAQVVRSLTVLGRAAARHADVRPAVAAVLEAEPVPRLLLAIDVATQVEEPLLVEVLNELRDRSSTAGAELDEELLEHLPPSSLALAASAVVWTRAALAVQLRTDEPDVESLARLRQNLSVRLLDVGRYDEALVEASRAVEHYEELSAAGEDFVDELAVALIALANALGACGFDEDGLERAARARELLRPRAHPSRESTQFYATALSTYGNFLGEASRHDEAVEVFEEAVQLTEECLRSVLEAGGDEREALYRLASATEGLSNALSGTGRVMEALTAVQEAAAVCRHLDDLDRDRFRVELVRVLGNESGAYSAVSRPDDAAAVAEEAVRYARRLVEHHGDAYRTEFADCLNNSAVALRRLGDHATAVARLTEALGLYRRLATMYPGRHLPDLAMALYNLGRSLADAGRDHTARDVVDESVDIYRKLSDPRTENLEPELVDALLLLADLRNDDGEHREAFELAEEAAGIVERLAADRRERSLRQLAKSLHLLADIAGDLNRWQDAVHFSDGAVAVYADLVAAEPPDLPDLRSEWARALHGLARALEEEDRAEAADEAYARAATALRGVPSEDRDDAWHGFSGLILHDHATCVSALGRDEDALALISDAVRAHRQVTDGAAESRHALAQSLNNLADTYHDLGRTSEAETAVDEAVEVAEELRTAGQPPDHAFLARIRSTRAVIVAARDVEEGVAELVRAWHAACHVEDEQLRSDIAEVVRQVAEPDPDRLRRAWQARSGEPCPLESA